jgi:hypothetical protein
MKLKKSFSALYKVVLAVCLLLSTSTELLAQPASYAAPGGQWQPTTRSWKGNTNQGTYPWTLTPRTGLFDEPFPAGNGAPWGDDPDTVVRAVNTQYYISESIQGFLEYLPTGYTNPANSSKTYPLIIYIPGCGEMHDGKTYVHNNSGVITPNWNYGLYRMMKSVSSTDQFHSLTRELLRNGDYFSNIPLKTPGQVYNTTTGPKQGVIVLSLNMSARPEVCTKYRVPTVFEVDRAINMALNNYRVDVSKIYLTGMSAGGGISYLYPADRSQFARRIAAVVPVAAVQNLYGDVNLAATMINNGVNVLAVTNRFDYNVSVIQNNRASIVALESIAGVGPTQVDSFFFLYPGQTGSNHDAWSVAYQTRGTNGQIANPTYAYVYRDPVSLEQYTAYEWMINKQNLLLLPVLVDRFSAVRENNGVRLDWSTSSEINSDKFIIERSTDGTSFSLLKEIDAAGNSSSQIKYTHMDGNLPASTYVYYRLSQRDKNGKLQIIGIKKIYLGNQGYEIAIYPTVATSTVNIEIQGTVNEQITVQVVDMAGRQLSQHIIAPRQNRLTINTDKLSKGMYIVQVSGGGKNQTSKFIKQ